MEIRYNLFCHIQSAADSCENNGKGEWKSHFDHSFDLIYSIIQPLLAMQAAPRSQRLNPLAASKVFCVSNIPDFFSYYN